MAAPNGSPATTETAMLDDSWSAQIKRAQALADAHEAAGQIPAHHLDSGKSSDGEEEPEQPTEEKPKPAAKKAPAKAKGEDDEPAESKEPEGAVAPQERAKWREQKRREREKLNDDRRKLDAALGEAQRKYAPIEAVHSMLEQGDLIGAVEKLTGKSWNEVQKVAIARAKGQDPRVERLERELAAEREERRKVQSEREEREEAAAQARAKADWISGLRDELGEGDDEIAALARNEKLGFLEDVHAAQAREYDPDTGETIPGREAAESAIENWRSLYNDLHEVFGERGASNPDASKGAAHRKGSTSAKPVAKAATTLTQRKAAEASPRAPAEMSDDEWKRKFTQRLSEARD